MLSAKTIVEGANYPCDADGEAVLRDRGIAVVPDILANSGGVIGSHLEVALDLGGVSPAAPRETCRSGIRERITNGFQEVQALSLAYRIDCLNERSPDG